MAGGRCGDNRLPRLILRLLGAPQIELNEQAIATDRRKAIALLAYLAVTGSRHSRETLAALFWPDYDQSQAFAYLRRTVWELNHALGEGWIESDRDTVGLTNGSEWQLDVSRFLELTNQWKAAVNGSGDAIDLLSEAVSMYRGDFLAGFTLRDSPDFDEWQVFQSENLRRRFGEALETLAGGYRERGDLDSAIDVARRWLALDPLNEPAHRELMRLYIKAGQRSAALRQYEECVRILHEELNVSPEPETTELYKQIKDSTRRAVQGLKVNEQPSSRLRPSNLPKPSTPFIGREKELAEILSLLADPNCRLLTLAGSGGIGKTRLSIRAAETQLDDYPHGVYFVSLAPLYSTDSLLLAIADTIGFTFYGRSARGETVQDPKLQLLEYLREKKMLLVMDNFEHLLDSAELLAKIAAAAPMVKFLVTSRERLNLPGEWVLDIQGMSYPDDGPSEAWEAYPAVELFLQSARRAQANFVLANSDRLHINRICQLVDGMPLGIELAAAWVKMMSCQEIAQEIEKSLDFLMTSLRGVPERHRSIRAVFEHSWNLMSEGEREALRRLSVFRCGFQREAAGRVAEATLARLSALTDKSILRRGPSGRWDLHEVLKQYAAAKLDETPAEKTDTNQRHSEYYLGLLGQLNGKLRGPAAREAIEQIEEEYENIRLAWSWAV
ncbi:MAG: tetratricopeptide repeat protein, partial [Chloroflexota bacterium]